MGEKPKKVCHDEYDEIVDTTIIEKCEEIITTKCEQVSTQARHSSGVVGHDSKVVATGVAASPERLFHMVVSPLDMDHPMDLMEALHMAKGKLRQMQSLRLRLKVPTMVTHPAFRSQLPFVRAFHKRCATTFPLTNPGKSRMLFVRLLLISKSLRIAKRLSPPIVNKPHKGFLTILLLLDMIQELAPLLLWTAMPLVIVMV